MLTVVEFCADALFSIAFGASVWSIHDSIKQAAPRIREIWLARFHMM